MPAAPLPQLRMPGLLGMLVSGIVIKNAVPGLINGLPREWSSGFRAAALCTIFLRSGLELDLKVRAEAQQGNRAPAQMYCLLCCWHERLVAGLSTWRQSA